MVVVVVVVVVMIMMMVIAQVEANSFVNQSAFKFYN